VPSCIQPVVAPRLPNASLQYGGPGPSNQAHTTLPRDTERVRHTTSFVWYVILTAVYPPRARSKSGCRLRNPDLPVKEPARNALYSQRQSLRNVIHHTGLGFVVWVRLSRAFGKANHRVGKVHNHRLEKELQSSAMGSSHAEFFEYSSSVAQCCASPQGLCTCSFLPV
jgi:hypothetical protein